MQGGTYNGRGLQELGRALANSEALRCLKLNDNFVAMNTATAGSTRAFRRQFYSPLARAALDPFRERVKRLSTDKFADIYTSLHSLIKTFGVASPCGDGGADSVVSTAVGQSLEDFDEVSSSSAQPMSHGSKQEEPATNEAALQALAEGLAKSHVAIVHMSNNIMSPDQVLAFTAHLMQCQTLLQLNISGCCRDDVDWLSTQLKSLVSIQDGEGQRELEIILAGAGPPATHRDTPIKNAASPKTLKLRLK